MFGLGVLVVLLGSLPAFAQGVQTGTLTGLVKSTDGLSLPGATVTVKSSALQGERSDVTDLNGVYAIHGLPPGPYVVTFELSNFQPTTNNDVQVTVGGTAEVMTTMSLATRTETVTVTAESPSPLATVTTGQAITKREVDVLPMGRRPVDIAELAPGLTTNTPNPNQVTISGGFAYDNVTMINGVDVNDNLFASANTLFIEDAIQETNVLTSGISAEFGRFTGGVINLITKSGGNKFDGSFRENLSNPKWIDETPREKSNNIVHQDVLGKTYEGTFGGPLVLDRLWFFSAGRYEKSDAPNTFAQTGGSYTRTTRNKRGELKFTGTPAANQTIQGSFTSNPTETANTSGVGASALMDAKTLVTTQVPNHLFAVNYNGVVSHRFFASMQYSEKKWGVRNSGGTSTNIKDSPFRARGVAAGVPSSNLFYAAPYFDSTDPEDRNNRQVTGSLVYSLPTKRFGTHDLKGGAEYFVTTRTGGNSQTSTGYVFRSDYLVQGGKPVVDAEGVPVPVFVPGVSRLDNWLPTRGARIDIKTTSLYFQDRWVAIPRMTFDLGTRFEAARGTATGDITTVDTTTIVPRLGATFDLEGNGKTVLQASYAHYAGRYNERQFGANTAVGNPSEIISLYTGPAGQGRDFAPGFDLANYTTIIGGGFPAANISSAEGLSSPIVREFTLGLGREFGRQRYAKATYSWRKTAHFVEDFIDLTNGITTITQLPTKPQFTNVVYNNTDGPTRGYQGLILQGNYRVRDTITIAAHYTLQIRNNGSFEGEAAGQPGNVSIFADYPEILGPALDRYMPDGRLADFQRHKLRIYGIYTQELGRFGSVDIAPLWRVNSAQSYSLFASGVPLTPIELARNPGYPATDISASTSETLYFGERGQYLFKGYGVLDLSATYSIPVWKTARPWLKVELYNVLNNDKLIGWDHSVTPDANGPKDANGLPTAYIQGPIFGQATNDNQFPQPYPGQNGGRAFRMAFGVRF